MSNKTSAPGLGVAALRRLARKRPDIEQCDFCSATLAPRHRHLLEVVPRKIICACEPCAMRFENVIGGRFKLIPRDARKLSAFQLSDAHWEGLALPIQLAFIFYRTGHEGVVAMYPSPAGATESLLPLNSWGEIVAANPVLAHMQPDVEALLVNRVAGARNYYLAPMDSCFELVGLIRRCWRGLSGGTEVWNEVRKFFERFEAETQETEPAPIEVTHA